MPKTPKPEPSVQIPYSDYYAIPCQTCMCLIHKTCSNLKDKVIEELMHDPNIWECPSCASELPFSKVDDIDIFLDSFNSNWTCNCKSKRHRYMPSPVSNEFKLIINRLDDDKKFIEDFDENFDNYHTLKPDFKYYETHQFHTMKNKTKDTFSLLHTNICSLQYNGENLQNLLAIQIQHSCLF